ncbi:MAG TPA: 6-bladed beta-propeller [Candidatus Cloacimonadota bacterium]|nr:6-bladed beta-propeller [Candidatus Cloacimonadota bacterium]
MTVIDITSAPMFAIENLSEISSNIDYIALETNENSLIDRIINLRVQNNFIYVGTLNSVLCFSKSGKFLFSLNKKGCGSDEYEFLLDFDINENNKILAIPSREDIVLYNQTEEGFNFSKRIKITNPTRKIDFAGKSDNILLQFSNSDGIIPYSKQLINLEGKVLLSWPNCMMYNKITVNMSISHTFENASCQFQSNLFLKALGNDTIFKLNENNIMESFLILNTKDKRVSPEIRSNVKFYAEHMDEYIIMQNIFYSERFFYYTYEYNKKTNHEIYDQLRMIRYSVHENEFLKDDISGGVNFEPKYSCDGIFYSWIEPYKLKKFIVDDSWRNLKVKCPEKKAALLELIDTFNDSDNPILIMAEIN